MNASENPGVTGEYSWNAEFDEPLGLSDFYTAQESRTERIAGISERLKWLEEARGDQLEDVELRRLGRVAAAHATTAIEGNTLALAQVEALDRDEPVFAQPEQRQESANALAAYRALDSFDPWSVEDFLEAHGTLTAGLIPESGQFRTVDVEIVNAAGEVLHTGSRAENVPRLMSEVLAWAENSDAHPLVTWSVVYMLGVIEGAVAAHERQILGESAQDAEGNR